MWLFGILSAWADTEPTTSNEDTDSSEVVEEATEDTIATPEETNPTDTSSESEQETPESTDPPPESETSSEDTSADDADELNEEEALQMLEEILNASLENMEDLEISETTEEDDYDSIDFPNYRGIFYYSYQIHRWKSPSTHTIFAGTVSGDPQYYFQHGNRWGTTLGFRFNLAFVESLNRMYYNPFFGITGGVQFGALRFNTAVSGFSERYFIEEEVAKDADFITYRYSELPSMSGVLWEQTLTYAPDGEDFGLQLTVGLPFQVNGTRDMGETIGESFSVSSKLNISLLHLGYQYTQYPGHSIQMAELGAGILK